MLRHFQQFFFLQCFWLIAEHRFLFICKILLCLQAMCHKWEKVLLVWVLELVCFL